MALRYGGNSSPRWLSLIVKAKTCRDERGSLLPGLKELPVNVEVPPPPPPPSIFSKILSVSVRVGIHGADKGDWLQGLGHNLTWLKIHVGIGVAVSCSECRSYQKSSNTRSRNLLA